MRIEQSKASDTDAIFWLYQAATEYMAGRSTVSWPAFERILVETEIREGRQWKMLEGDEIVCVWAIAFNDAQIWQSLDNNNAVYIHRIATHPGHRGKGFVKTILHWAAGYTNGLHRDFVRLDTVGENQGLIKHYQQCGFRFLGLSKLQDTVGLPTHYQDATVSLFELDVKKNKVSELSVYKTQYSISTNREQLNLTMIHDFLCHHAYWCPGIPFDRVETAANHSLNFGVYHLGQQIGYARIITDFSSIAYLGDVFILTAWRGKGLSKWLMETIMEHPALQGMRRWILLTGDAHGLYGQYGWTPIASPYDWMELHDKNVYQAFIKTATSVSLTSPA